MAKILARIVDDHVAELITEVRDVTVEWSPAFLKTCVDVTHLDPRPEVNWRYDGANFSPPAVVGLTRAQQMNAALVHGHDVPETGTFDAIGSRWERLWTEAQYVAAFGAFSAGRATLPWVAMDTTVTFAKPADLLATARSIADWVASWQAFVDGHSDTAPGS